ncbi:MAG: LytTR family DNA-binding domain-containing protein [Saprospiraceae bacterium]|nr:LytTR family DNA-binding domain-containing protein [Saprospiraceae bacterium]
MPERIRCLIVEDEPLAAEVLADYIAEVLHLELVGICEDAIYASSLLKQESIDLLFLDIHLPKLKGLDFLRMLTHPPQVILTTAYHQYALEAFEYDVVDYLLKPIEFERFLQAIHKVKIASGAETPSITTTEVEEPFRFFRVNKRNVKVLLKDIIYVESLKEYVRIHTEQNTIVTKFQIGELQRVLGMPNFLRIHRSYLVAKNKISAYSATEVEVKGKSLPIGRTYREEVQANLSKFLETGD